MSNLYSPYFLNVNAVLSYGYTTPTGLSSATLRAELHDTSDNNWAHAPHIVGAISGTVSIAGTVIAGAKVVLMSELDDVPVAYTLTEADGTFTFPDLNRNAKFYVMVKLPTGWETWEYMVSSRRIPA